MTECCYAECCYAEFRYAEQNYVIKDTDGQKILTPFLIRFTSLLFALLTPFMKENVQNHSILLFKFKTFFNSLWNKFQDQKTKMNERKT